jgi:predicted lipoprotein with Yx(FWY)xxD motif
MRPRIFPIMIVLGAAAMIALLVVGCGSSNNSSSSTSAAGTPNYQGAGSSTTTAAASGPATVAVANNPKLGQIVVDGKGRTVYLFEKDDSADESYCYGGCAKVWTPVTTTGTPQANGVPASKISTFKRKDGTTQVSFDGHPLYYYVDDTKPGDANGNNLDQFGAEWYAMHPNGKNAE